MSSSFSLLSKSQTPSSAYYTLDQYNCASERHKRHSGHTQRSLPSYAIAPSPLAPRNYPTHVIAARTNSCMQFDFGTEQTTFTPQQAWLSPPEHISHTTNFDNEEFISAQRALGVDSAHPLASAEPWSMQSSRNNSNSVGAFGASLVDGVKRQNSHQRASSTSTIASNGPASPYSFPAANPHIANTEIPPFDHTVDFAKNSFPTQHGSTNPAYLSASYQPLQAFARPSNQHFNDYTQHYSMSHSDRVSPSTPSSNPEELDTRQQQQQRSRWGNDAENRSLHHPQVQLSRTESAAYQDELYNPANFVAAPTSAAKPARQPAQRTLVNQYLESANMARSVSPNSAVSRERSPFREGSELAPSESWASPHNPVQTAASRRQQIKLEREQAELAAHRPQLRREPTKTISPKDALLDYNESDQAPLIQDAVPTGYKQHLGGSEPYTDSSTTLKDSTFNLPITTQSNNMAGFRAATDAFTAQSFAFSPPASQASSNMQNPFHMGAYQQLGHLDPAYAAVSLAEPTPQFPAQLTSMESSISDQGLAVSSQDSNITSMARPADTRANAGVYTCTYHGCAQRFESPALLQKHKKEFHRSQQQQQVRESLSVEASSESPRSTESPGPAGSGLTSAQILARNSQAGPHKCTRTNPSTGKPCNTVFSRPYDLTRHEDTIHNGRKHKVRCPYCREEKTFSRNDALTRHMRVVHPDVENFGKRSRRGD